MATTTTTLSATTVMLLAFLGTGNPALAMPPDRLVVVIHVTNPARVAAADLITAEQLAAEVYGKIGLHIVWTDSHAATAPADGAMHLDVVILSEAMSAMRQPSQTVFGSARYEARRAWVYEARIEQHALSTHGNPIRALALVLAHEIGHLLLPDYSHARTGLMRAEWNGRIVIIPDFGPTEGRAIRATVAENARRIAAMAAAEASGMDEE